MGTGLDLESQRKAIDKLMGDIAPGHGKAELEVTLPDGRIALVMATRVNDRWLIQGSAFAVTSTMEWGAQFKVVKSW